MDLGWVVIASDEPDTQVTVHSPTTGPNRYAIEVSDVDNVPAKALRLATTSFPLRRSHGDSAVSPDPNGVSATVSNT